MNLVKKINNQLSPQLTWQDKDIKEGLKAMSMKVYIAGDWKAQGDCRQCPEAYQCLADKSIIP